MMELRKKVASLRLDAAQRTCFRARLPLPAARLSTVARDAAANTAPPPGSHAKPVRASHLTDAQSSLPGLGWLEAGITRTVIEGKRGPRLHPGMHGLDLRDWLLVDPATYGLHVGERERALDTPGRREEVLQASDPETLRVQEEVLHLISDHLLTRFPQHFQRHSATSIGVSVGGYERLVDAADFASPLEAAARLVQEDLVLMRHDAEQHPEEYRIAAAAVAFSFDNLPQRVQQRHSMAQLHTKVGNYASDLHKLVSRALAALKVSSPMWRSNWSFTFTGSMAPHPDDYVTDLEKRARFFPDAPVTEWDGPDGLVRRIDAQGAGAVVFVKVEYQTLRRLPCHDDYVLFAVRAHLTPLHQLKAQPRAAALLADNVRGAVQLDFRHYKGLGDARIADRVIAYLDECASPG